MLSEKSDEERVVGGSDKLESSGDTCDDSLSFASATDKESDGAVIDWRRESTMLERKTNILSSYSTGREVDEDTVTREGPKDLRLKEIVVEEKYGSIDRYGRCSEHRDDQWTYGTNHYTKMNRSESVNSSIGEISPQRKQFSGSVRTRVSTRGQGVRAAGFEGLYGNSKAIGKQGRTPNFDSPDGGLSTCRPDSFNSHGWWTKNGDDLSEPIGVKDLEHDILRRLDELKEQLSRSYNVADKPRERISVNETPPVPYGSQGPCNLSMQSPSMGEQIQRSPYFNYRHRPSYMNHHNFDMQNFYPPPRHILNEIPEYDDPFRPQTSGMPHEMPHSYSKQQSHEYFITRHMEFDLDPRSSHPHKTFFHPPVCSCSHCQDYLVPPQVPENVIGNRRFPNVPINSNLYHHVTPVMFGTESHNPRGPNSSLQSHDPHLKTKWPSDHVLDNDSHGQSYPKRVVAARGIGKFYRPIAGGAPFITCCSCFELLKLHRKLTMNNKNQKKLRCGACSAVMVIEVENKRLISIPWESRHVSAELDQDSSDVLKDSLLSSHGLNAGCTNSCFNNFNSSDYNSQLGGTNSLVEDQRSNSDESERKQGHTSTISIASKEEEIPECTTVLRDVSDSAELPSKSALSPTSPGSPLWQQSETPKHVINRYGQANKSNFTDNDKMVFNGVALQQNSEKAMPVTTEVDTSFNEYLDTCISQDSAEASKEDQSTVSKGTNSFFPGFIKKSFRDFSRSKLSVEDEMPNVSINGQPIPDGVVRKAEKLAGPVRPGDYW